MTSRERIIETLNHSQPDRVAIDFGATNATGVHAVVYKELKELLEISAGEIKVLDIIAQLAEIELEVLEKMGGDVVMVRKLAPSLGIPIRGWKPGKLTDGSDCIVADLYQPVVDQSRNLLLYKLTDGSDMVHPFPLDESPSLFHRGRVVAKCPVGSHAFCRVYHPLSEIDTIEALEKFGFPELTDEEIEFAENEAKRLYSFTDKAVCGIFQGNIFEIGQLYWGYEKFFLNLAGDPDFVQYFLTMRMKALMRDLEQYLKAVGSYIQIIDFWDDLGAQSSLLISPRMYREMIKPCHAMMFGYVRKNYPDVKVFFHSCGAVYDLIPDFIEAGVQILNPVQITAEGMDPVRLKKNFGKEISFWGGGVDTQHMLNSGTEDQVRKMAREMLDIFSPGGGYVFSQVHNVESCVPARNLLVAFETAKNYKSL